MRYDLFISHSSADADDGARAWWPSSRVAASLKCWVAPRDMPIGARATSVRSCRAIENSRAGSAAVLPHANESEHVLREVELAEQAKKPIYPMQD